MYLTLSDMLGACRVSYNKQSKYNCPHPHQMELNSLSMQWAGLWKEQTASVLPFSCAISSPSPGMAAMQKLLDSRLMGSVQQAADGWCLMPAPVCCQSSDGTFNIAAANCLEAHLFYF